MPVGTKRATVPVQSVQVHHVITSIQSKSAYEQDVYLWIRLPKEDLYERVLIR